MAGIGTAGAEVATATPHGSAGAPDSDFLTKLNPEAVLVERVRRSGERPIVPDQRMGRRCQSQGSGHRGAAMRDGKETALLLDAAGERKAVALLNQFLKRLSVEPEDKSRLISISFTSRIPKRRRSSPTSSSMSTCKASWRPNLKVLGAPRNGSKCDWPSLARPSNRWNRASSDSAPNPEVTASISSPNAWRSSPAS